MHTKMILLKWKILQKIIKLLKINYLFLECKRIDALEFNEETYNSEHLLAKRDIEREKILENGMYKDVLLKLWTMKSKDEKQAFISKFIDKAIRLVVICVISFSIKPCKKNAFIGMSGSGKTTIFKLLLKKYDNYNGQILIDGHNIKDFSEKSLRNTISIVSQEPMLFNMSIKENLLMVNKNASDEQIKYACKLANIDEFIEKLPNKYDEIVLENNNDLSVGQKQRLAIARVILKNTPIILFDEVTDSLSHKLRKNAYIQVSKNKMLNIKTKNSLF